jgi:hypothetical protein
MRVRAYINGADFSRALTLKFYRHRGGIMNLTISGGRPLGPELARTLWQALNGAPRSAKPRRIIGAMTHFLPGES